MTGPIIFNLFCELFGDKLQDKQKAYCCHQNTVPVIDMIWLEKVFFNIKYDLFRYMYYALPKCLAAKDFFSEII